MARRAKASQRPAVAYLRRSSAETVEQGELALARQRAAIETLAASHGVTITTWYSEIRSAYSKRGRPEYEAMLEAVRAGQVGAIYVFAVDRLLRRTRDLVSLVDVLQALDVPVHSVTGSSLDLSTSEGRLQARLLGSLAEFESERRADRLIARNHQRAHSQRQLWASGVKPFGFRALPGGAAGMEIDSETAPVLAEAYERVRMGATLTSVCKWLNGGGWRGPLGAEWTATTLKNVLLAERNCGLVAFKGEVVGEVATGERIVPVETWYEVRAILTDPERPNAGRAPATTLLGGLVVCMCGGKMSSTLKSQRAGDGYKNVAVYKCRECSRSRRQQFVLPAVVEAVATYLDVHAGSWVAGTAAPAPGDGAAVEVARLEAQMGELADLLAAGELDAAAYAFATRRLSRQLNEAMTEAKRSRPVLTALGSEPGAAFLAAVEAGDPAARDVVVEVVAAVRLREPAGRRPSFEDLDIAWRE